MISKGRRKSLYLYEVTKQDLVLSDRTSEDYAAGNILMFADKRNVSFGKEVAKADDFSAAVEYLDSANDLVSEHFKHLEETVAAQQQELKQRDNLLSDLTEDLDSQKYSNQVLIAQLEQVRTQIEIERLSREEAVDDLQLVSAETQSLDTELAKAMDDKLVLEQELAARITDLIELDLQNNELKRSLETRSTVVQDINDKAKPKPEPENPSEILTGGILTGEILTMASGKQIHIYHDFPTITKGSNGFWQSSSNFFRIILMIVLALIIAAAASVIATSRLNAISLGESLDLLLRSLGL